MKISFFILALLIVSFVGAQIPVDRFSKSLASRKYSNYSQDFKKALKQDSLIDYGNYESKQLIKDYKLLYCEIYNRYPLDGDKHTLKLIRKGDKIIFCSFSFTEVQRIGEKRNFINHIIESYTDSILYEKFKRDFYKLYGADLSESDLWKFKSVGQFGGLRITLGNFLQYDQMISFVESNERDSLLNWVRSISIENQMFGLWGFNILLEKGKDFSDQERKFIKVALARKGYGMVAVGSCFFEKLTIIKFLKRYELLKILEQR